MGSAFAFVCAGGPATAAVALRDGWPGRARPLHCARADAAPSARYDDTPRPTQPYIPPVRSVTTPWFLLARHSYQPCVFDQISTLGRKFTITWVLSARQRLAIIMCFRSFHSQLQYRNTMVFVSLPTCGFG